MAYTVKGKGIKVMEDKAQSHYWMNISEDIYNEELIQLESSDE